jgi:hypothetical protein
MRHATSLVILEVREHARPESRSFNVMLSGSWITSRCRAVQDDEAGIVQRSVKRRNECLTLL